MQAHIPREIAFLDRINLAILLDGIDEGLFDVSVPLDGNDMDDEYVHVYVTPKEKAELGTRHPNTLLENRISGMNVEQLLAGESGYYSEPKLLDQLLESLHQIGEEGTRVVWTSYNFDTNSHSREQVVEINGTHVKVHYCDSDFGVYGDYCDEPDPRTGRLKGKSRLTIDGRANPESLDQRALDINLGQGDGQANQSSYIQRGLTAIKDFAPYVAGTAAASFGLWFLMDRYIFNNDVAYSVGEAGTMAAATALVVSVGVYGLRFFDRTADPRS